MRVSLREIFFNAMEAMAETKRDKWVLEWPGQIVIAGSQTQWSADVTTAIQAGPGGLPAFFDVMKGQLADLVRLVRGELGSIQREVLSALIVIEVHARDVVETMVKQGVSKLSDFEWISQLRYYWETDAAGEEDLRVKAVNAVFNYGYEYLGNSGRLVITPLTDRCYLTLTGALALVFGGAPAGPAGTGKTETTKDLAKALAVQCVGAFVYLSFLQKKTSLCSYANFSPLCSVFNCSDRASLFSWDFKSLCLLCYSQILLFCRHFFFCFFRARLSGFYRKLRAL
jgi:dynein heavy chain